METVTKSVQGIYEDHKSKLKAIVTALYWWTNSQSSKERIYWLNFIGNFGSKIILNEHWERLKCNQIYSGEMSLRYRSFSLQVWCLSRVCVDVVEDCLNGIEDFSPGFFVVMSTKVFYKNSLYSISIYRYIDVDTFRGR